MRKSLPTLIALVAMLFMCVGSADAMTREQLISYASSLNGKKKADLKTAIYKLCNSPKVLGYGSGSGCTWSGFVKTDRIGNTLECRNRYSTDRFYFSSPSQTSAISGMNIEHSFPKSWWGGDKNNAYKDLYNLYPSESKSNSSKGNYVMDKVSNASQLNSYEKVGTGANASSYASNASKYAVEPADEWKGDFSRSYFYMVTIYQNLTWTSAGLSALENNTWPTLQKWAYTLYMQWADDDIVDDIEVDRNNAVYAIQGNRNLFIDFPYLDEYVWGDSTDVAFDVENAITTASDDGRYNGHNTRDEKESSVKKPVFSPDGGTYSKAQSVTITSATSGATIYYTTDGTTPTTSSTQYTGAITVSSTTTIKAIAVHQGESSSVATAVYTIGGSGSGDDSGTYKYKKVTSVTSGKRYLIVANNSGALEAMSPLASSKTYGYPAQYDVTATDDVITLTTKDYEFVFTTSGSGYTIQQQKDSRYLWQESGYNTLSAADSPSSNNIWAVTAQTDGTFKIYNTSTRKYIQYSTSHDSYGCYSNSSGILPNLYELVEGEDVPETTPVCYKYDERDDWMYMTADNSGAYNIVDNDYYAFKVTEDVANVGINYTRDFSETNVWKAWFVPFSLTLTDDLLSHFTFARFDKVVNSNGENEIGVVTLSSGDVVQANTPYVVKSDLGDGYTFSLTSSTLYQSTEGNAVTLTSGSTTYTIKGIYTSKTTSEDDYGWYALSLKEGKFSQENDYDITLNPFRFYLTITTASGASTDAKPQSLPIRVIDGTSTGISNVNAGGEKGEQRIYDLQGRRVKAPTAKGVYIINGRKVVIGK